MNVFSEVNFGNRNRVDWGITTFSSFSLEIFDLLANHQYLLGFGYAALSLISGIIGAWLGILLGEKLHPREDKSEW